MSMTALVFGATGLVGSELLHYLLEDRRIGVIKVFVRRPTGITHPKLTEFIVDFDQIDQWKHEIQGDLLFSALGTTLKQSGSRAAQRVVDYDYQLRVVQIAKLNGLKNVTIVSAPHAHPKSPFAYTRMKGDLERDVLKLGFAKLTFIRPGLLKGPREQKRPVEQTSAKFLNFLPIIPGLEALKPVSGKLVAHACLESALDQKQGFRILGPKDVLQILRN